MNHSNFPAYEYHYHKKIFHISYEPQAILRILASLKILADYFKQARSLAGLSFVKENLDKIIKKYLKNNNSFCYLEVNHIIDIGINGCLLLAINEGNARATAAVTESLIEAYQLAKYIGNHDRTAKYHKAIMLALRFVLQSQYSTDNTFNPDILGSYKNSFFDANIQIDNLQHIASLLLNVTNYVCFQTKF